MTSQSEESPICSEGHGFMVPIDWECCLVNDVGQVVAIAEWRVDEQSGDVVCMGYAPDAEAMAQLPSGDRLGDEIAELEARGKLVSIYDVMDAGEGFLRVDDNRRGHKWGYFVWLGNESQTSVSFQPGVVYHWFPDDEEHSKDRLETFEEVVALVNSGDARLVTGYHDNIAGQDRDSDAVLQELGDISRGLIVWDRGAMQRSGRAS